MQQFTIRDIENLTGIKAHTLRIWEQRYHFFTPKRKESQHRFYDNEDLKKLLRISFLYHQGLKISKIASLSEEEIASRVANTEISEGDELRFVTRLIEAAVDFDSATFTAILDDIIAKTGFEKCITGICFPYLQKIGLLWSTNRVIPAQEHFSSYLIQNRIISETEKLPVSNKRPEIILVCPKGEYHELPLLFINYLLRKNNWSTLYIGTNIGREEIMELSAHSGIGYIYLHLVTNFTGMYADDYFEEICKTFPGKKVYASGNGATQVQRNFVNLRVLKSDREVYEFINRAI